MKKAIATLSLFAAVVAGQAHASTQEAPVQANATVSVTGASTIAGAPLLLALNGAKAIDPSFDELFKAAQAHPKWKVTSVKAQGEKSRLFLKSDTDKSTIEMDVSSELVKNLKLKKASSIQIETQSSGQAALIKFVSGTTPIGFMVNKSTVVSGQQ